MFTLGDTHGDTGTMVGVFIVVVLVFVQEFNIGPNFKRQLYKRMSYIKIYNRLE